RCRNCGYDFSLAETGALPDLALRREPPDVKPLEDLALVDRTTPAATTARSAADVDAAPDRGDRAPSASSRPSPDALSSFEPELPLFGGPITDDVPLITKPSPPRQPLAVRRATPEVPRLKADPPRPPMLDLDL